ncbi:MAG: hypothetical protein J2P25_21325, partial [Nocardiopsaceae bacterium]|nr:hypothetical protein [Nocardiopsaceae bacterium]
VAVPAGPRRSPAAPEAPAPGKPAPGKQAPEGLALLDALSWLPERVATAARRGRPDEFARYLERVADFTIAALTCPRGSDRLVLARAARAGLAASLELLGASAPDRLLRKLVQRKLLPKQRRKSSDERATPRASAPRGSARAGGRPERAGRAHLAAERGTGSRERRAHARRRGRARPRGALRHPGLRDRPRRRAAALPGLQRRVRG